MFGHALCKERLISRVVLSKNAGHDRAFRRSDQRGGLTGFLWSFAKFAGCVMRRSSVTLKGISHDGCRDGDEAGAFGSNDIRKRCVLKLFRFLEVFVHSLVIFKWRPLAKMRRLQKNSQMKVITSLRNHRLFPSITAHIEERLNEIGKLHTCFAHDRDRSPEVNTKTVHA